MTLHPVPKGRPKGALNHATRELKEELHKFFSSPEYRQSVEDRIIAGTAPTVEIYLLQMLYGKPREVVDVHVGVEVEELAASSVRKLGTSCREPDDEGSRDRRIGEADSS